MCPLKPSELSQRHSYRSLHRHTFVVRPPTVSCYLAFSTSLTSGLESSVSLIGWSLSEMSSVPHCIAPSGKKHCSSGRVTSSSYWLSSLAVVDIASGEVAWVSQADVSPLCQVHPKWPLAKGVVGCELWIHCRVHNCASRLATPCSHYSSRCGQYMAVGPDKYDCRAPSPVPLRLRSSF